MCSIFPSLLAELLVEQGDAFHDIFIIDQDGSKHSASRLVLAAHSDFFLALFTHSPKEQTTFDLSIVKRGSDTATGLGSVLHWMETGEVELEEESVLEVLQTAEYLGVLRLSLLCQQVRGWRWRCSGWSVSWNLPTLLASGNFPRSCPWRGWARSRGPTSSSILGRCSRGRSCASCRPPPWRGSSPRTS